MQQEGNNKQATIPRRTVVAGIVAIALLIGVVVGAIYFLKTAGLQASVIWTGAFGLITWLVRSTQERRDEYRRLMADQKREQYDGFLKFMQQIAAADKDLKAEALNIDEMRMWSLRLGMIASDEVIRAWNVIRNPAEVIELAAKDPVKVLRPYAKLLLAMRKDCGHFDTSLKPSEMLELFTNDVQPHRQAIDLGR